MIRHVLRHFSRAALLVCLLAVILPHNTQGQTIKVACSAAALVAAIVDADATPEADVLKLAPNCQYNFSSGDPDTPDSALPRIDSPITIKGKGASLIRQAAGDVEFRLLYVSSAGFLQLVDVTVSGGKSAGHGGGIYNMGILQVKKSRITGNTAAGRAGGIYNNDGQLVVIDSVISGNNAGDNGGGIYNSAGDMTIESGSKISKNDAPLSGGGIYTINGPTTITDAKISGNSAFYGGGITAVGSVTSLTDTKLNRNEATNGGGIRLEGASSHLVLMRTKLSRNAASAYGGGLEIVDGTATVSDSTLAKNSAGGHGGGISNSDSLTMSNSTVTANTAGTNGGGIYNDAWINVSGSTLVGNMAEQSGGGLYNIFGATISIVTDTEFSGNSANQRGGALFNSNSTLQLNGTTISANDAGQYGGGIANGNQGHINALDLTLQDNTAGSDGGGLYNAAASMQTGSAAIDGGTISGNHADGDGGGVYNGPWHSFTILKALVAGNTSDADGGGISNAGTASLVSVTAADNLAAGSGGGVHNINQITIVNGAIFRNTAGTNGGGVYNSGATAEVSSTTIADNSAGGNGDGVYHNGTMTLANSIVWGQPSGVIHNTSGLNLTVSYSIVQGGWSGTGNQTADPMFFDPTERDYRLKPGSPARNAASNALLASDQFDLDGDHVTAEPVALDLDGWPRLVAATVDMGAYEVRGLLRNADFEADTDGNKVPDGWKLKDASGDKLMCKPDKSNTGTCAFQFKGGPGEKTSLTQTLDLTGLTPSIGDTLALFASIKATHPSADVQIVLKIAYDAAPPTKSKRTVDQNTVYESIITGGIEIEADGVSSIKLKIKNRSTGGKVLVDTMNILHVAAPRDTRADVMPPPHAPDGFRGSN